MTATATTTTTAPTTGRGRRIALWAVLVLLAAVMLFAGLGKVLGDPAQVAGFQAMGAPDWFRFLTGSLEIAAAVGLLIPRISGLTAGALVAFFAVAVVITAVVNGVLFALVPAVMLVVFAALTYARRDTVRSLVVR